MESDQRDPQTYAIIGAAMEVHNTLGHGFLEAVYHEALVFELIRLNIPFQRECALPVIYKGTQLACNYKADLVCYESVLVELKALTRLSGSEEAQVLNYLRASRVPKGLLIRAFSAHAGSYPQLLK